MIQNRVASRASCAIRAGTRRPIPRSINARSRFQQQARFDSTSATGPSSTGNANNAGSSALYGGLAGSLATLTVGYIWYRQSGAKELLTATKTTKDYVNTASKKLKEATPEPNEALDWLRDMAKSYAAFIPGAKGYVDAAFDDIDAIRSKHGDEVDKIVSEAYEELRSVAQKGELDVATAQKAWSIVVKHLGRIGDLAGDAAQQIMDNHPQLKEKVGGNLDYLKEMGNNYGPEVKKEVDRTWEQIADIVKTGVSAANIEKIRKLVEEKKEKLQKLGDQAWEKGMEEAKPYLEKSPKVKELIEENADALKKGKWADLYEKVKKAAESGDMGDLESYVKSAADKAKQSGFGDINQYLEKIPGGSEIIPKLTQLQKVAEKHGDEAQRILKDAVKDISDVLKKHGDEAAKVAEKAKEDSKK